MIATFSELAECLEYNSETGLIRWKKRTSNRVNVGDIAGKIDNYGYVKICFRRAMYSAHRIAMCLYNGEWPSGDVDHVNGIRNDNRISNLRAVSARENLWNMKCHRDDNKTPCILFDPRYKNRPWRSRIHHNGNRIYVGAFPTKEEAIAARDRALAELKES